MHRNILIFQSPTQMKHHLIVAKIKNKNFYLIKISLKDNYFIYFEIWLYTNNNNNNNNYYCYKIIIAIIMTIIIKAIIIIKTSNIIIRITKRLVLIIMKVNPFHIRTQSRIK
jgi:hypothetical protein